MFFVRPRSSGGAPPKLRFCQGFNLNTAICEVVKRHFGPRATWNCRRGQREHCASVRRSAGLGGAVEQPAPADHHTSRERVSVAGAGTKAVEHVFGPGATRGCRWLQRKHGPLTRSSTLSCRSVQRSTVADYYTCLGKGAVGGVVFKTIEDILGPRATRSCRRVSEKTDPQVSVPPLSVVPYSTPPLPITSALGPPAIDPSLRLVPKL